MNNFIDQEIASSISDGANYYELGYTLTAFSADPASYRKIRVTVVRPGLAVIARDGYFPTEKSAPAMAAEAPMNVEQLKFDLTRPLSTSSATTVSTWVPGSSLRESMWYTSPRRALNGGRTARGM